MAEIVNDTCIHITGGYELHGEINISGAKNAALPCLFASLLTNQEVRISNIPQVADIQTTKNILTALGKKLTCNNDEFIISNAITSTEIPLDDARAVRASILALGPLLAKNNEAYLPLPGGCDFGSRPIDIHIRSLEKMGAEITMEGGILKANCKELIGTHLVLDFPTFTGTENLLMAACLAKGETIVENAACEPEVANLGSLLISMGAKISGLGTSKLIINGVDELHTNENHQILPDRIEAGTYLATIVATRGNVILNNVIVDDLRIVIDKLMQTKATITEINDTKLAISMNERANAVDVATAPHPGFPTDLQAQFLAFDTIANGSAQIVDNIWEQRFRTADELKLLGADIVVAGNTATVKGVDKLNGAHVQASDLRASAALVIAGLAASGETVIHGARHLQRGYEKLPDKLNNLGAKVSLK